MPPRKKRTVVVLDTNVVLGFYLSRNQASPNAQVFRLWRDRRRLQLILSSDLTAEYLEVLPRLGIEEKKVARLAERLETRETVTHVNLGARATESRDPDDNVVLSTAAAGRARFLVTNDRDLLDIPASQRKKFKFEIVTPIELLTRLREKDRRV
ncbi:MAG: putative toxin-antitoxin system toxin component, PIN family [Acidobacteriota bacterium]